MRIALVADVPHQPVVRRVEHVVERGRQFHHAQAGAEMAAGGADGGDHFLAQFVRELAELVGV